VRHHASRRFWKAYAELPQDAREAANKSFKLLKTNPMHPSLRLKQVGRFYSVRIGSGYRALGLKTGEGLLWFWVGSHDDYERLLRE